MHYNNIGLMYDLMEDHEKALYYFEKSYVLKKKLIGPSKTVILSMRNLGLQYIRRKEYTKTLELVEENWATFDQVANRDMNTKVNILEVQSIAYVELGEYALAEPLLREMYEVKKVATPGHSYNRMILKYLGQALRGQGKFEEAGEVLTEAYCMGKSEGPGGFGPLEFEILQELGNLGIDMGDMVSAKEYFQNAVDERHRWGDYNLKEDNVGKARDAFQDMMDLVRKFESKPSEIIVSVPAPCSQDDNVCCIEFSTNPKKGIVEETIPKFLCEEVEGVCPPGACMTENIFPVYIPPKKTSPFYDQTGDHKWNPFGRIESDMRNPKTSLQNETSVRVNSSGQIVSSSPFQVLSGGFQTIQSTCSSASSSPCDPMQSRTTHQASSTGPNQSTGHMIYSPRPRPVGPLPSQSDKNTTTLDSSTFPLSQSPVLGSSLTRPTAKYSQGQFNTNEDVSGAFGHHSPPRQNAPTLPKQTSTDEKLPTLESITPPFIIGQIQAPSFGYNLPGKKAPTPLPTQITNVDSMVIRQHSESVSSHEECSIDGNRGMHGVFGAQSFVAAPQPGTGPDHDTVPKQLHSSEETSTDEKLPTLESIAPPFIIGENQAPPFGYNLSGKKASTPLPTQTSTDEKVPSLNSGVFSQNRLTPGPKAPTPLPKQTSTDEKAATLESGVFWQSRPIIRGNLERQNAPAFPKQSRADEKVPTLECLSLYPQDITNVDSMVIRQHSESVSSPEECSIDGNRGMHGVFGPTPQSGISHDHDTVPQQLYSSSGNVSLGYAGSPGHSFAEAGPLHNPSHSCNCMYHLQPQFSTSHGPERHLMRRGGHHPPISAGLRSRSLEEGSVSQQMNCPHSMSEGLQTCQPQTVPSPPRTEDMYNVGPAATDTQRCSVEELGAGMMNIVPHSGDENLLRQYSYPECFSSGGFDEGGGVQQQLCHPPQSWHPPSGCQSLSTPSPSVLGPNLGGQGPLDLSHCIIHMD
jgi:hypothetical protein